MNSTLPKRLLRKGTRSCAECKRRKTRCFFERPNTSVCVGCQRRGTACTSQEFIDVPHIDTTEEETNDARLKRVERMLENITEKLLSENRPATVEVEKGDSNFGFSAEVADAVERPPNKHVKHGEDVHYSETTSTMKIYPGDCSGTRPTKQVQTEPTSLRDRQERHTDTCRTLHAALPSQQDADILFEAGRAAVFLQALCNSYSNLFEKWDVQSSSTLSALPPMTSHPVILARKLLHVALCIQQLDPSFDQSRLNLGRDLQDVMKKYYSVVSSMVTCHDDLLDSLEGLECLVCEAVYLVNVGSLRRALACLRRALTIGQFMGLHRPRSSRSIKQHDPSTRISCTVTWNHIAYLERYLSLLLGMPSFIPRARFAPEEKPQGEFSSEWFEKVQIEICGDIIDRNQTQDHDFATTQRIDFELNRVANGLSTEWWSPMELHPEMNEQEIMSRVISAQMQIVHYNLLTVLHLPFLMRDILDHRYDYSKITCTYASREVLNRFIKFRSVVRVVFCCRLVDFCAFTAALTLVLSHLNSHGQSSTGLLTHQRLGDRALIEKAMSIMDDLNQLNNDELSRETSGLTRRLLDLEAKYVRGYEVNTASIVEDECDKAKDITHTFNLEIPYFGTVRLSREISLTKCSELSEIDVRKRDGSMFTLQPTPSSKIDTAASNINGENLGLQPVLLQPEGHLTGSDDLLLLMDPPLNELLQHDQPQFHMEMPDLMASADEWAFQGVDAAFFDNLIGWNWANEA